MLMYPKPKRTLKKNKISKSEKQRVYEAVKERASIDGHPACEHIMPSGERCKHNGSVYYLQMCHPDGHNYPKSRDLRTKVEWVYMKCDYCHSMGNHYGSKPILGETIDNFWDLPRE